MALSTTRKLRRTDVSLLNANFSLFSPNNSLQSNVTSTEIMSFDENVRQDTRQITLNPMWKNGLHLVERSSGNSGNTKMRPLAERARNLPGDIVERKRTKTKTRRTGPKRAETHRSQETETEVDLACISCKNRLRKHGSWLLWDKEAEIG